MSKKINRDWLGLDPYKLRKNRRHAKVSAKQSLYDAIKKHNLWPNPSLPKKMPKNPGVADDFIHLVWLGERKIGANSIGKQNILSWKKKNPEKVTIVWTNTVNPATGKSFPKEVLKERIDWCKKNNIILLDIDDFFAHKIGDLEAALLRELLKPNYGPSGDIIRWFILKFYGGLYADIDIRCLKPLGPMIAPQGMRINCAKRSYSDRFKGYKFSELITDSTTPDLVIAVQGSSLIEEIINLTRERYKLKASELHKRGIPLTHKGYVTYEACLPELSTHEFNRATAMMRAGPGALGNLFGYNYNEVLKKKGKDFIIDPSYFEFQSGRTWLDTGSKKISDANPSVISNQILSNILADLKIDDERVLRLDSYVKRLKEFDLADKILMRLARDYPLLANKIQYVKFEGCINLNNTSSKRFFANLFNKDNFKHLNRDSKLYRENFKSIDFLYEQGIDLTKANVYNYVMRNSKDPIAISTVVAHYKKRGLPLKKSTKKTRQHRRAYHLERAAQKP